MRVGGWTQRLFGNIVARVLLYYAALGVLIALFWRYLPASALPSGSGEAVVAVTGRQAAAAAQVPTHPGALGAVVSMSGAALLSLPVAWIYVLTRAKRGYQQSVVQMLVILPMVVAGVVALVKESLPLAFGLAGIVAAVRFRTALDDSKDAVYVFLATGVGLAAAVDLQVAAAVSVVFNATMLLMWHTDFGRTPPALDGRRAERRMQRLLEQMSRTGTFVARMDDEVFQDMPAEQLQAVADRAWRRARRHNPELPDPEGRRESLLRVRTYDAAATRATLEPLLEEQVKKWRFGGVVHEADGVDVLEYTVVFRKGAAPNALLETLRGADEPRLVGAELG